MSHPDVMAKTMRSAMENGVGIGSHPGFAELQGFGRRRMSVPRASLQTLASAMDVGDPSNMERLRNLVGDADVLREQLGVLSVDDDSIRSSIRQDFDEFGFATCPHTATATWAWRHLDEDVAAGHDWILVATAHPAKFETIVEPLIGEPVPVPPELAELLARPARAQTIQPTLAALARELG